MKKIVFSVEGMSCNSCENRVINGLKSIEGIIEVEASYQDRTVTVIVEQEGLELPIQNKIEMLGYDVIGKK